MLPRRNRSSVPVIFSEIRAAAAARQKSILIEQHLFIKRHVGDANRRFIAQRTVVAKDRNFMDRIAMPVERAVSIVITDRICRRQIGNPAGFQKRIEPRV